MFRKLMAALAAGLLAVAAHAAASQVAVAAQVRTILDEYGDQVRVADLP